MILTITAGKGGVGKSTVAFNLGAELDAVVVDADLGMADLPAGRGPNLHDVLAGRASPIEAVRDCGHVKLAPCGRSLAGANAADPRALVDTVRNLRREFDRVVIDSPAGMCSDVGIPLLAADACLLVTRPTRPAVADAVRTRELARAIGTPLTRVVLNRVTDGQQRSRGQRRAEPAGRYDQIANTLGAPVTPVPESEALARAQRAGQPVAAVAPDSVASHRFDDLAATLETTNRKNS
jgi:septum site-determining protein MinD